MSTKRLKPAVRKEEILAAALILAAEYGYSSVTRDAIAYQAKVSGPAVQYHFGTMAKLRVELMRYAVKQRDPRVVAQGLAVRDRQAAKADAELKREAMAVML
jgi:AcrR family transcriptional regulator